MLAIANLASLSEGWREAQYDYPFVVALNVFICLIGPFWILFRGGADTLLGAVWLLTNIIIVRRIYVMANLFLEQRIWWKTYKDYLWGCVFLPLPLMTWLFLNAIYMVGWFYFHRS